MQDKLYQEICEHCPVDKEPFVVDYEMIRKMKYLEMIFKETIRYGRILFQNLRFKYVPNHFISDSILPCQPLVVSLESPLPTMALSFQQALTFTYLGSLCIDKREFGVRMPLNSIPIDFCQSVPMKGIILHGLRLVWESEIALDTFMLKCLLKLALYNL